jgi:hypothetical protein
MISAISSDTELEITLRWLPAPAVQGSALRALQSVPSHNLLNSR